MGSCLIGSGGASCPQGGRLGVALLVSAAVALFALPVMAEDAEDAENTEDVVAYEIIDGREISASLTGQPGDPERGRELYLDNKLARCAGCHGIPGAAPTDDLPANDALSLDDVGARLSTGAIRLSLIAPEILRPATRMPSYYGLGQRADPADPRYGEPLMTAGEIEDLVAYLAEQRGG